MRSNCFFFALPRWLRKAPPGEEVYLIFRRSRVAWGFCHTLIGKLDHATGQIAVESYKPPPGHRKNRPAPVFDGTVVQGDAETTHGDLT